MSLPANIYPLAQKAVQKRSKDEERESLRLRQKVREKLNIEQFTLREAGRRSGVSYSLISMFLHGFEISPRSEHRLKEWVGLNKRTRKPRPRKDKRLLPSPAHWIPDAI